jgi:hypothetical protein
LVCFFFLERDMNIKIKLPKLHAAQLEIKKNLVRHNVISAGRRIGKNFLLCDLAANEAMNGRFVGWLAPVFKQTHDDFRSLSNLLAPIIARQSVSEMRIELVGGGVVEFWSGDHADAIRGKKYHLFIVNEAGFISNLVDIRNFIIIPTLIDYSGRDIYAGTPKGMNGFYALYTQTGEDWQRWHMSSYANPFIPKKELDDLRVAMNERAFQQEILAEFIEDGAGVFRNVRKQATVKRLEAGESGVQYVIGADWGRTDDATVFCVLDMARGACVYMDRMTDTDFATQRMRLKVLAGRFNDATCLVETNSIGQPQLEELQRMGVSVTGFNTTNTTKAQIIDALALAYEQGKITTIDDETLINELVAYTSERLPSGLIRYSAPEGLHDDTVIGLALAWWAANNGNNWLIS